MHCCSDMPLSLLPLYWVEVFSKVLPVLGSTLMKMIKALKDPSLFSMERKPAPTNVYVPIVCYFVLSIHRDLRYIHLTIDWSHHCQLVIGLVWQLLRYFCSSFQVRSWRISVATWVSKILVEKFVWNICPIFFLSGGSHFYNTMFWDYLPPP